MNSGLLFDLLKLAGGIVLLLIGGDFLVKGGVGLAKHFKVSTLVMGLTVVAFGTSAPELIVSMGAAMSNHPEIALGNVIGSNIANIALVLALTVIIHPMPVAGNTIKRSWPVMLLSGIILYLFMLDNKLGHFEGMILFALLILFIVRSIRGNSGFVPTDSSKPSVNKFTKKGYLVMVVLASVGLAIGSRFLIQGASGIASDLGVSERVISLTVVAFGTSIPELTASIIAAIRKEADISVGNIIGSNIFNVYAVIGLTSIFKNIRFRFTEFQIDLYFMLLFFILLFLAFLPLRTAWKNRSNLQVWYGNVNSGKIGRLPGLIFVSLYALYLFLILKSKPL